MKIPRPSSRRFALIVALHALLTFGLSAQSAPAPAAAPTRAPADGPFLPAPALPGGMVLALYPADSPQLKRERLHESENYNSTSGGSGPKVQSTLNIHNPSIEVHLAGGRSSNGAAVIVAPGGGHKILWVGPEGLDFVPYFAQFGVSTIVLRNRLRVDGYDAKIDAVNDAFQAIRIVRAHAAEWKLDPAKIGFIGFSAGAELAAPAALFFDAYQQKNGATSDPLAQVSARPDFVGLLYPGPTPYAKGETPEIPKNVPPTFIVCAGSGDRVHAVWATEYFTPMLQRGVPNLEMHIYGRGNHGGGLKYRDGIPLGTWQDRFMDWFRDLGFLGKPGLETKAAADVAAFAAQKSP
ncbi:MAG: alpha/beta hydrolase fold domain-containing protein [Undibacterium sp.]|nr:alpha/beta hydrolase fold domain-containing protein [Opitutaceae bacterium]